MIDTIGGQAEHLWFGDCAPTLKATHCKSPPCVVIPVAWFCPEQSEKTRGIGYEEERAPTLRAGVVPGVVYSIENHPNDSRVGIDDSGKCRTLTSRMGTGGGNVPMFMEPVLCMAHGQANAEIMEDKSPCLNCNHEQHIVAGLDCRNGKINGDLCGTLQAKPNGGFSYNCTHPVLIKYLFHYIVRRLIPMECARLQGFPDEWGKPTEKTDFTDDELDFWVDVRNTNAPRPLSSRRDTARVSTGSPDGPEPWYSSPTPDSV